MQIAQATDGNCTARAISTMRLALGYETGLPDDWKPGHKEILELASLLGDCFPNEMVIIACREEGIEEVAFPDNTKYIGPVIPFGEKAGQINADDYLIAFSYGAPNTDKAHMVVGFPVIYDLSAFIVYIIVAVNLPKSNAGAVAVNLEYGSGR